MLMARFPGQGLPAAAHLSKELTDLVTRPSTDRFWKSRFDNVLNTKLCANAIRHC
jgi:hypothetical protein